MFGRKISVGNDLYEKLKKCSESAGYATPEEFALHTLEKEVERILAGDDHGGSVADEAASTLPLQGTDHID